MGLEPIANGQVRRNVRWLYMGSGLIFLATVGLGIANVFTTDISRGQILAHLHSGTIGWITLSVLATAFWAFTGQRDVGGGTATVTTWLTWGGLLAVAGYVVSFGFAFNGDAPFWLLPLFGIPAWLVILSGFLFTAVHLRRQAVVTTPHLLLSGALLVASLAATMGVLQGLTYNGTNLFPAGADAVGSHAGPMDLYLALAFAAVVEILLVQGGGQKWGWAGMTQAVLGVLGGFGVNAALLTGIGPLIPLSLLLFLLSFGFYFVRVGWRTFATNPARGGRAPAVFFGGLGFPLYIGMFVWFVVGYFIPEEPVPHLLNVAFAHVTFVLLATNLVLAIQSTYAGKLEGRGVEFYGYWTLNVGLAAFVASEAMGGRKDGALLMALGVLITLYAVWMRLARVPRAPRAPHDMG